MKVLLIQLDGKLPNIALMRVAAHHRALGDHVSFKRIGNEKELWRAWNTSQERNDRVYASLIFERTKPLAEKLKRLRSDAIVGGTGWDLCTKLEDHGIETKEQDYSLYPDFTASIGFTQRGCRLKCSFCVVPKTEGANVESQTVSELWRGRPYPRHLHLLDNDFFGQLNWRERIREIREGGFRVSFSQGINVRLLDEEVAAALASVHYTDDSFTRKRLYTAWDNKKDEARLFAGLELLKKHGVKPDHVMVYMLIGYWPGETAEDRLYRQRKLREFGCRPYPMPYARTPELVGFQRWCVGAYDKRVPWEDWERAKYQPRNLGRRLEVA